MPQSRLQHNEIPLREFGPGFVIMEPAVGRTKVQLQLVGHGLRFCELSPDEAYAVGSSLVEHALECGYDPDTGETYLVAD